jgi:hypothetical protein
MQNLAGLKIMVFKNTSDNAKAPAFKGMVKDGEGNKLGEIALWYADDRETGEQKLDKAGNPYLTGSIQEPFKAKS